MKRSEIIVGRTYLIKHPKTGNGSDWKVVKIDAIPSRDFTSYKKTYIFHAVNRYTGEKFGFRSTSAFRELVR